MRQKETMGPKRKLLILTHNYPRWEGDFSGVFLQELVDHFRRDGVMVNVLCPHFKGCPTLERGENLEICRFRYAPQKWETLAYAGNMHTQVKSITGIIKLALFMAAFFFETISIINRVKPDLIFAQWLIPSGFIGWLVSVITGKKLFLTSHGTDIALAKKSKLIRFIARRIYKRTVKAFTVSRFLRETVLDLDLATPAKLEVIPMPARTDLFGKQRVVERDPPLILSVARFTRQKQLDVLLKALKALEEKNILFSCEIYGKGEMEKELLSLIEELSLGNKVFLKAPISQQELAQVYPSARVTVLPSINEGFGMTLVEAQLSGSAVIGAASGGITDIIKHESTGLLFEPGNSEQLASEIEAVLNDNQLHHHLVKEAKEHSEREFTPDRIATRYLQTLGLTARN